MQYLADLFKDFSINNLLSAFIGTAAGALIATIIAERKTKHQKYTEKIEAANIAISLSFVHFTNFVENVKKYREKYKRYLYESYVFKNTENLPVESRPDINQNSSTNLYIDLNDYKSLISKSTSNPDILMLASYFTDTVPVIVEANGIVNSLLDEINEIRKEDREKALNIYFGIPINGQIDARFHDHLNIIFENFEICTLILERIIDSLIEESTQEIKKYKAKSCKTLPEIVTYDVDFFKKLDYYPKQKEYRIFKIIDLKNKKITL